MIIDISQQLRLRFTMLLWGSMPPDRNYEPYDHNKNHTIYMFITQDKPTRSMQTPPHIQSVGNASQHSGYDFCALQWTTHPYHKVIAAKEPVWSVLGVDKGEVHTIAFCNCVYSYVIAVLSAVLR